MSSAPTGVVPGRRLLLSLLLHLLFVILLVALAGSGTALPARRTIQAVLVSSVVHPGTEQAAPAAPPSPAPKEKKPALKPKSADKPAVKPAASATSQSRSPTSKEQTGVETDEDSNSLLSRLRANWLAPPHAAPVFRCRLRIDYRPGGMISAVTVQQGCGDRSLGDSIERAVWKTQPLPLQAGAPATGSVELEFSP